jgi:hypothetical protein
MKTAFGFISAQKSKEEKNAMKKLVCLLLVACMLCASLVACNNKGGSGGSGDGGDKNGDWANLDFKGDTLTVSVSKNDPIETTFKNSAIYMKGPDNASTKEPVQKKVLARNKKVADDLNMTIKYQETDWIYSEVLPHLKKLVEYNASDAPDVYNNDMRPLFNAMMSGYAWNITNPTDKKGNAVKSYFDFDHECWYKEYMEGATFSKDKQFILVGDFNIDIIRWAWVIFVNVDLWNTAYGNFTENDPYYNFRDYDSACELIDMTEDWFHDDLIALAGVAHIDGSTGTPEQADLTDDRIGLQLSAICSRLFTYGSGYSVFEWTKNGKPANECEGVPSLVTDTTDLEKIGLSFTKIYNAKGVYNWPGYREQEGAESINEFIKGKTVMINATLGEMESPSVRDSDIKVRGVLPFPRYNREVELTTVVHDQAEVSIILSNSKNFTLASAYLQYINEESTAILDFYYDEVLKFKYNKSEGARLMIDLINSNVTTPFEALLNLQVCTEAGATGRPDSEIKLLHQIFADDAKKNASTSNFRSAYDAQRGAMQTTLDSLYKKFNELK